MTKQMTEPEIKEFEADLLTILTSLHEDAINTPFQWNRQFPLHLRNAVNKISTTNLASFSTLIATVCQSTLITCEIASGNFAEMAKFWYTSFSENFPVIVYDDWLISHANNYNIFKVISRPTRLQMICAWEAKFEQYCNEPLFQATLDMNLQQIREALIANMSETRWVKMNRLVCMCFTAEERTIAVLSASSLFEPKLVFYDDTIDYMVNPMLYSIVMDDIEDADMSCMYTFD